MIQVQTQSVTYLSPSGKRVCLLRLNVCVSLQVSVRVWGSIWLVWNCSCSSPPCSSVSPGLRSLEPCPVWRVSWGSLTPQQSSWSEPCHGDHLLTLTTSLSLRASHNVSKLAGWKKQETAVSVVIHWTGRSRLQDIITVYFIDSTTGNCNLQSTQY